MPNGPQTRLETAISRPRDPAATSEWVRGIQKYMMYFLRKDATFPKRCAVAISPMTAVTYEDGGNSQLKERHFNDERTFSNGDYLELYFLFDEKRKPVRTEVVLTSGLSDFILLEATDGQMFFHGDIEQHNFEVPQEGQEILCIGLTNETVSQQAIAHGVVQNDVPDKRDHIVADFITWPADSGGGVFSRTNSFLVIVSALICPKGKKDKFNYTRTHVVSLMIIKHGWKTFLESSGKVAGYSGIRPEEE
ncbi:hypothetical protein M3Y98_00848600 [Aphelenchoides besseyi]|nr:hypothetical protein M3Y98_00848600 [Aphelenchoides besseyi]